MVNSNILTRHRNPLKIEIHTNYKFRIFDFKLYSSNSFYLRLEMWCASNVHRTICTKRRLCLFSLEWAMPDCKCGASCWLGGGNFFFVAHDASSRFGDTIEAHTDRGA